MKVERRTQCGEENHNERHTYDRPSLKIIEDICVILLGNRIRIMSDIIILEILYVVI